jgi:hypothetical protein
MSCPWYKQVAAFVALWAVALVVIAWVLWDHFVVRRWRGRRRRRP